MYNLFYINKFLNFYIFIPILQEQKKEKKIWQMSSIYYGAVSMLLI